jgi:hypothetical protein
MASSGKGSTTGSKGYGGAGRGSYGGLSSTYGKSGVGYAGKGRGLYGLSDGLYGKNALYSGLGTGYGNPKGIVTKLGGDSPLRMETFYLAKSQLRTSYLQKLNAIMGIKSKYSQRNVSKNNSDGFVIDDKDLYERRMALEQRIRKCPVCGRDPLSCGCLN